MATIAIIGGGFCGVEVAKGLGKRHDVTLFDRKDYFEYTPSVHKIITDSAYEKKIRIQYKSFLHAKIVTEEIKSITASSVVTENNSYGFDYLVVCSGASTQKPDNRNVYVLKDGEGAKAINHAMHDNEEVTIIGGGFTGTEIAGELATKTQKKVKLINGAPRLLERMNKEVGERAADFLHSRGVKMMLNKAVPEKDLESGFFIWSIGIKPNTNILKGFPKDSRGFVMVEPTLQVKGMPRIFAGGDITDIREEKSAQNAENHGKLIAENIRRVMNGKQPRKYKTGTRIMLVSLGDRYSIFCYGKHVFDGIIPALMKKALEVYILIRLKWL